MLPTSRCINRRVYSRPYPYIDCGIRVRIHTEATRKAEELGLAFSVLFGAVCPHARTTARRIARVNKGDGETGHLRLVDHELTELSESPITHLPLHHRG